MQKAKYILNYNDYNDYNYIMSNFNLLNDNIYLSKKNYEENKLPDLYKTLVTKNGDLFVLNYEKISGKYYIKLIDNNYLINKFYLSNLL